MLGLFVKLSVLVLPILTAITNIDRQHKLTLSTSSSNSQTHYNTYLKQKPINKRKMLTTNNKRWSSKTSTHSKLVEHSYDYVIVGAGSAGSVLASRLSQHPKRFSVLLLEAGGSENILTDIPIAYQLMQKSSLDWNYSTLPQQHACFGLNNRSSYWPRGRVLGGTSVLNVMLYTRGNPNDFDSWPPGWQWNDVLPYFKRSEHNTDLDIALDTKYHSTSGPLFVGRAPYVTELAHAFVDSAPELGYSKLEDLNGQTQSGFAIPQTTNRRGARCSTAKAFLYPSASKRSNLHISSYSFVTQILFDKNKRAVGVAFEKQTVNKKVISKHVVRAKREVILSAGAINSPHLLQVSGVGDAEQLARVGVPLVAHVRGVGENLQDHIYPGGIHFTINKPVSLSASRIFKAKNVLKYLISGKGPLTSTGVDGLAFVSTKIALEAQKDKLIDWPDIELHLIPANVIADNGRYFEHLAGLSQYLWPYYDKYKHKSSFSIDPVLLRPYSRGYVRLRSPHAHEPPLIDPRYLSDPRDLATIVEGMKLAIAVGLSEPFKNRFNSKLFATALPGCEHYEFISDTYLACVARTLTWTIYHPTSTCKMVSNRLQDPMGVVDANLNVFGVSKLRVVDASIMPQIISGNTNAPVIMIAERAADIILNNLDLNKIKPKT